MQKIYHARGHQAFVAHLSVADLYEENKGFEEFADAVIMALGNEGYYDDSDGEVLCIYFPDPAGGYVEPPEQRERDFLLNNRFCGFLGDGTPVFQPRREKDAKRLLEAVRDRIQETPLS